MYDMTGDIGTMEFADAVFERARQHLLSSLPWLDEAFGRAERVAKEGYGGRRVYLPAIFARKWNDYTLLTPDSGLGNFCFFVAHDPLEVEWGDRLQVPVSGRYSLVLWWDYRRIATGHQRGAVERQVLDALASLVLPGGRLGVSKVYALAENIYQGFTLDEVDNQFLMHPYGGMRVEGVYSVAGSCSP